MATRVVVPSEIYYNDSNGEEQMLDVDFIASVEEDRDERGNFINVEDITWEKEGFTPEENEAIELELERLYKLVVDKAYKAYERMKKDQEPPYVEEVRRMQKIAGIKSSHLNEDDYDMGTPSGDTDAMNIAEDDKDGSFGGTVRAGEEYPVV